MPASLSRRRRVRRIAGAVLLAAVILAVWQATRGPRYLGHGVGHYFPRLVAAERIDDPRAPLETPGLEALPMLIAAANTPNSAAWDRVDRWRGELPDSWQAHLPEVQDSEDIRTAAIEILGRVGRLPGGDRALTNAYRRLAPFSRPEFLESVPGLAGDPQVYADLLRHELHGPAEEGREIAAGALLSLDVRPTLPAEVRAALVERDLPSIIAYYEQHADGFLRGGSFRAGLPLLLRTLGPKARPAVPLLRRLATNESRRLRVAATFSLAMIAPEERALAQYLATRADRMEADEILFYADEARSYAGAAGADAASVVATLRRLLDRPLSLAPVANPLTVTAAGSPPSISPSGLVRVLGALGNWQTNAAGAVPRIAGFLESSPAVVRRTAAVALARIGPAPGLDPALVRAGLVDGPPTPALVCLAAQHGPAGAIWLPELRAIAADAVTYTNRFRGAGLSVSPALMTRYGLRPSPVDAIQPSSVAVTVNVGAGLGFWPGLDLSGTNRQGWIPGLAPGSADISSPESLIAARRRRLERMTTRGPEWLTLAELAAAAVAAIEGRPWSPPPGRTGEVPQGMTSVPENEIFNHRGTF